MCVKCGGCPAYGKLLTCLFCEDGETCPCGGWEKAQQAAAQQPRLRPGKRARKERESGGASSQADSPAPSPAEIAAAPEVRLPVRFDGGFLERRMREFYGADENAEPPGAGKWREWIRA